MELDDLLYRPTSLLISHIFFFSWRYNPHLGVVFYSPLVGFNLLAYEVS